MDSGSEAGMTKCETRIVISYVSLFDIWDTLKNIQFGFKALPTSLALLKSLGNIPLYVIFILSLQCLSILNLSPRVSLL